MRRGILANTLLYRATSQRRPYKPAFFIVYGKEPFTGKRGASNALIFTAQTKYDFSV